MCINFIKAQLLTETHKGERDIAQSGIYFSLLLKRRQFYMISEHKDIIQYTKSSSHQVWFLYYPKVSKRIVQTDIEFHRRRYPNFLTLINLYTILRDLDT